MKKKQRPIKDNSIYEVYYKWTISGGDPCETGAWSITTVAANDSAEVKEKLKAHLLEENKHLEHFVSLTLKFNMIERIGKIGLI